MSESGYPGWKLSLGIAIAFGGAIAFPSNTALAQSRILPDSTLGAESSTVTLPDAATDEIRGGAIRGSNLFHSFLEFNVGEGRAAYFISPNTNILNILARVTGRVRSEILGTLGTRGGANPNLFLINPNGIIFGPNAKLDVSGSFVASTARSFTFADGTFFSATQPQTTPLLTISVPIGLQYGSIAGSLQVQGSQLEVRPDRTLALVGGNVSIDGGQIRTPGGRVELGGLLGEGIIEIGRTNNILNLNFPNDIQRADVSLINRSTVNVLAGGGGDIAINAQNLEISGVSVLRAGIASGLDSPDTKAGNIQINATDAITIANESGITSKLLSEAVGVGGDINITTGSLSGNNGAQLAAVTLGKGNAGNVTINARDTISFDGVSANGFSSGVFSRVEATGQGNGGNINITAGSFYLTNGAFLTSNTLGQGNAGSVKITVRDRISFDGVGNNGPSGVFSQVWEGAIGKGNDIEITTGSLVVTNGALISSSSFGGGDGGSVRVQARDGVVFDGMGTTQFPVFGRTEFASGALSIVGEQAAGNAGSIEIIAGSLSLSNDAELSASTFGQGDAGHITIRARNRVVFDGVFSGVFSVVLPQAVGKGGNIDIGTGSLSLSNGAEISSSTFGWGDAGRIKIDADQVSFDGVANNGRASGVFNRVGETGFGNGGSIEILAGSFSLTNGAEVSSTTFGRGDAGHINIEAHDRVSLDGVSSNGLTSGVFSRVAEEAVGNGRGIDITTGSLTIINGALLTTSSDGNGTAGNINLRADSIRLDNEAEISADTVGGQGNIEVRSPLLILRRNSNITTNARGTNIPGGNITLNTDILAALENSDISANSQDFQGGNITINAQGIFGTQFREAPTPASDITATGANSSLSGTVQINTPDVDRSRGLVHSLIQPVNVQVAQGCQAGGESSIAFFDLGRGGLAPDPYEPFSSNNIWEDVPSTTRETFTQSSQQTRNTPTLPDKIVEAQGWVINEKGEVVLVTETSSSRCLNPCRLR